MYFKESGLELYLYSVESIAKTSFNLSAVAHKQFFFRNTNEHTMLLKCYCMWLMVIEIYDAIF